MKSRERNDRRGSASSDDNMLVSAASDDSMLVSPRTSPVQAEHMVVGLMLKSTLCDRGMLTVFGRNIDFLAAGGNVRSIDGPRQLTGYCLVGAFCLQTLFTVFLCPTCQACDL